MPEPSARVYIQAILFLIPLIFIGYFVQRDETLLLLTSWVLLFTVYWWVLSAYDPKDLKFWIVSSIVFRIALLLTVPSLSDDVYRFIWDGRLSANGFHPFAELPGFYLSIDNSIPGIDQELYNKLNSPEYFTIYPPVAQAVFWIAAKAFPTSVMGNIVVIRLVILIAEIGSLVFLVKLIKHFKLDTKSVLLYALNPLVIIELAGNLHFEGVVIFFLLACIGFVVQTRIAASGVSLALAVGAKLLPLVFLPLFILRLGTKRTVVLYWSVGVTTVILFAPLFDMEIISKFGQSLELYFRSFEFNAGIYYLVREYGYLTSGYNIIQTVGWKLALISTALILIYSLSPYSILWKSEIRFVKRFDSSFALVKLPMAMMWVLLIYFLFTTTVHPWYITTLLMLSVFTGYRFVVLWSGLIFLTYAGYTDSHFEEKPILTILEYAIVIGYLAYELIWKKKEYVQA